MEQKDIHSLVVSCLRDCRCEIVERWVERLNVEGKFLLFQMSGDIRHTLDAFFSEILSIYDGVHTEMPKLPYYPVSMDVARKEVHILLIGEEVFVELMRKYLQLTGKDWIIARCKMNEVFHSALRNNSLTACDCCCWAKNEYIGELERLGKMIPDFLSGHSNRDCKINNPKADDIGAILSIN